ncbi:hypothetical protein JKP88DRAFT_281735 [Tribonema minus]|uniref:Uncharacterized protein n=1 Tax=Tribonema minus TaxID=303371 RepID=A0A835YQC8_9STRA|nr:hypothetical protein JKP88DRAFT_281735 [Tribonema minus]
MTYFVSAEVKLQEERRRLSTCLAEATQGVAEEQQRVSILQERLQQSKKAEAAAQRELERQCAADSAALLQLRSRVSELEEDAARMATVLASARAADGNAGTKSCANNSGGRAAVAAATVAAARAAAAAAAAAAAHATAVAAEHGAAAAAREAARLAAAAARAAAAAAAAAAAHAAAVAAARGAAAAAREAAAAAHATKAAAAAHATRVATRRASISAARRSMRAAGRSLGRLLSRRQQKRREYWSAHTPEEQQRLRDWQARHKALHRRHASKERRGDGAQPPDAAAAGRRGARKLAKWWSESPQLAEHGIEVPELNLTAMLAMLTKSNAAHTLLRTASAAAEQRRRGTAAAAAAAATAAAGAGAQAANFKRMRFPGGQRGQGAAAYAASSSMQPGTFVAQQGGAPTAAGMGAVLEWATLQQPRGDAQRRGSVLPVLLLLEGITQLGLSQAQQWVARVLIRMDAAC